ncbi:similar to Kazachstania africana KAFR_0B05600 hypothetical protein [Maudiozyma barnettii]|uniref:Uncharacterized protein n=1 Tax=Maudiozyma barnettii TaxID=61262 RepID=A0A8H2ZL13_9SACH|nr:uncharacterized protein KABA2_07S02442 [Kazachstania barnettii]CAB4255697.1 similar to Kazachstania africana KAFR_0B05600 hypothetical protein [Kazachstania barnettii]CAD1784258.1 similar to Kazachstania africana KAFR_0B05600 hypothetical protein [Kazachstania barnettii]
MSESHSSDVFRRLQISPSKNNAIKKPALRLSPRKVSKTRDLQYTPSKYETHLNSDRFTQSLDRSSRLFMSRTSSPSNQSHQNEHTTSNPISILKQGPATNTSRLLGNNLLNKLREEASIPSRVDKLMNENKMRYKSKLEEKNVKFYLPTDDNTKEEISTIKSMLEQIISRQNTLERSIEDIKSTLRKKR